MKVSPGELTFSRSERMPHGINRMRRAPADGKLGAVNSGGCDARADAEPGHLHSLTPILCARMR